MTHAYAISRTPPVQRETAGPDLAEELDQAEQRVAIRAIPPEERLRIAGIDGREQPWLGTREHAERLIRETAVWYGERLTDRRWHGWLWQAVVAGSGGVAAELTHTGEDNAGCAMCLASVDERGAATTAGECGDRPHVVGGRRARVVAPRPAVDDEEALPIACRAWVRVQVGRGNGREIRDPCSPRCRRTGQLLREPVRPASTAIMAWCLPRRSAVPWCSARERFFLPGAAGPAA